MYILKNQVYKYITQVKYDYKFQIQIGYPKESDIYSF